ncbi:MAG: hypothetical protein Q9227_001047 [Pyrenula ochraceoflavens]
MTSTDLEYEGFDNYINPFSASFYQATESFGPSDFIETLEHNSHEHTEASTLPDNLIHHCYNFNLPADTGASHRTNENTPSAPARHSSHAPTRSRPKPQPTLKQQRRQKLKTPRNVRAMNTTEEPQTSESDYEVESSSNGSTPPRTTRKRQRETEPPRDEDQQKSKRPKLSQKNRNNWARLKNMVNVQDLIIKNPSGYRLPDLFAKRQYKGYEGFPPIYERLPPGIDTKNPADFILKYPNHLQGQPLLWLTEVAPGGPWGARKIYNHLHQNVRQKDDERHASRSQQRETEGRMQLISHQPHGRITKSIVAARNWLIEHFTEGDPSVIKKMPEYDTKKISEFCQQKSRPLLSLSEKKRETMLRSLQNLSRKVENRVFPDVDTAEEAIKVEVLQQHDLLLAKEYLEAAGTARAPNQINESVKDIWAAQYYAWMMLLGKIGLDEIERQCPAGKLEKDHRKLIALQTRLLDKKFLAQVAEMSEQGVDMDTLTIDRHEVLSNQAFILAKWRIDWATELWHLLKTRFEQNPPPDDNDDEEEDDVLTEVETGSAIDDEMP